MRRRQGLLNKNIKDLKVKTTFKRHLKRYLTHQLQNSIKFQVIYNTKNKYGYLPMQAIFFLFHSQICFKFIRNLLFLNFLIVSVFPT